MKMLLAWQSIFDDRVMLNLDRPQEKEITDAIDRSRKTVEDRIMDSYCWLLVPFQAGADPIQWEEYRLSGIEHIVQKASRKMKSDELIITQWSPYLLKMQLDKQLWQGKNYIVTKDLWGYLCQYCYLPRLKDAEVIYNTIRQGLMSDEYFGYAEGVDNSEKFISLSLGKVPFSINMQTGLLVRTDIAKQQIAEKQSQQEPSSDPNKPSEGGGEPTTQTPLPPSLPTKTQTKPIRFFASGKLDVGKAGSGAGKIDEEVLYHLTKLPGAQVEVRVDIQVKIPGGIPDDVLRTILENSKVLKLEAGMEDE
jgi:hypothetical protein